MKLRLSPEAIAGTVLVLVLHGAAVWGLWSHRLIALPPAATLFVDLIAPPALPHPSRVEKLAGAAPPVPRAALPLPVQIAADAPAVPAVASVAPPPQIASAPVETITAGPVRLDTELAVSCLERPAPGYPLLSRRMNETGTAILRVELDEQGRVNSALVATSSGSMRLDEAALTAVKAWRCNPAQRNGQPVRAVALQPFKFQLQGN
jgi:protein TonB